MKPINIESTNEMFLFSIIQGLCVDLRSWKITWTRKNLSGLWPWNWKRLLLSRCALIISITVSIMTLMTLPSSINCLAWEKDRDGKLYIYLQPLNWLLEFPEYQFPLFTCIINSISSFMEHKRKYYAQDFRTQKGF